LAVPVAGLLTSQGREPAWQATRVTQKVQEARLMQSKLKRKGKANVDDEAKEEARVERLRKVKAKIAVLQDIVNQLEA
jgi:hypothetical protein